jgi:hypothetical protein
VKNKLKWSKLKNWKDLGAFADIMKWNVEKTGSRAFVGMMKQEVDTMLSVTNFWGNALWTQTC